MTDAEFRDALRLLECVLHPLRRPRPAADSAARDRLRQAAREFHLLRARLGQPQPGRQRN